MENAKGRVTYEKVSGSRYVKVSRNGKVKVKPGIRPGTYVFKVRITAAGTANYKKAVKTVKVNLLVAS